MYHMHFKTSHFGIHIFEIISSEIPVPRIGEKVSYNKEHYIVDDVRHRFADVEGPEQTCIVISLSFDPDMVYPAHLGKPREVAAPPLVMV